MFKKSMVIIGGLAMVALLHACSGAAPAIQYEGKERPVADVEEMLADKLESENPNLDITVDIQESID